MRRLTHFLSLLAMAAAQAAEAPAILSVGDRAGGAGAAAGDVVEIAGTNLASAEIAASQWPLPRALASTRVLCGVHEAPLLTVAENRIRIQLPWELAGLPSTELRVRHAGRESPAWRLELAAYAPRILSAEPPAASAGQTVTLRAAGLGLRLRNPLTGDAPSPDAPGRAAALLLVTIGGVPAPVTNQELANSGDVQLDAGVQQITVHVPWNAPSGPAVPLRLYIGGEASNELPIAIEPPAARLSLLPAAANVPVGGSQQFSFQLDGSSGGDVAWSLDANSYGVPNQPSFWGSLERGLFRAAHQLAVPDWTIVRATHSSGAFATALLRIVPRDSVPYRIVPDSAVVAAGETIRFRLLNASGAAVEDAEWRITDGFSWRHGGTYTAPLSFPPPQVHVWAMRAGSALEAASTTLFIAPPRARITGVSPAIAHIGDELTFLGEGLAGRTTQVTFSGADGSRISVTGRGATALVPHGAVSGPVIFTARGDQGAAFSSPSFHLTILPRLRLRPSRLRVSSGETIEISATAPDIPGPWPLTWRADFGGIDPSGKFTAPTVSRSAYARIWACLLQDTECATTVVEVVPFRLDPDPLIVNPGEEFTLRAWQGAGQVAAGWSPRTPNLEVRGDGRATAGAGPFDGGAATVTATVGSITQTLDLTIRSPGASAFSSEYVDWLGYDNNSPNLRQALGVFTHAAATRGDWVYALSRSLRFNTGPWLTHWLDVYRLDAARRPVWVDSAAAPAEGKLSLNGGVLSVLGRLGEQDVLLNYDVSSGRPVLLDRKVFPRGAGVLPSSGLAFSLTAREPLDPLNHLQLEIADPTSGARRVLDLDYKPLAGYRATIAGTRTWAAILFSYSGLTAANNVTVVFDITGSKARPAALLPAGRPGDSVTALEDVLVVGSDVFHVSEAGVTFAAELPARFVIDSEPASKRLLMSRGYAWQVDGCRVVDLSDPFHPKVSAPAMSPIQNPWGVLGTDYFLLGGGPGNLSVHRMVWEPGARLVDTFPASPLMTGARARDGYLYWTGVGAGVRGRPVSRGIFEVVDLSVQPFRTAAALDRPGDAIGWAVELNGAYAYVGTDIELLTYDISSPTSPRLVHVIPAPAISFALHGQYLYAGSFDASRRTLLVYDVSSPASPRLVSTLELPQFAYELAAHAGRLAAAMGKHGLGIYSLANPGLPNRIWLRPGLFWGVALSGDLLFAAADRNGLEIYRLAEDDHITPVSRTSLAAGTEPLNEWYPIALSVSLDPRGIAWLTTPKDGRVYGLDIRNPGQPRHVFELQTQIGALEANQAVVWKDLLIVTGNNAAFDTGHLSNVGLYHGRQPAPGDVQPDRFGDKAPITVASTEPPLPFKAAALAAGPGRPALRERHLVTPPAPPASNGLR